MTDSPKELPFSALTGALRGLRTLGRDIPDVKSFAILSLTPAALILLGALYGGVWPAIALLWILLGVDYLDHRLPKPAPDAPEGAAFPAADLLSQAVAVMHFVLLVATVGAVAGFSGLGWPNRILVLLAAGLWFGQVSNANAHELIHRGERKLFALGKWVYISLLYGHHVSAHRLVHHTAVATPKDPATATLNESFWAYLPRAWRGGFEAGLAVEKARDAQRRDALGRKPTLKQRIKALNPYVIYVLGGSWFLIGSVLFFGWTGLIAYVALCTLAQMQLLLSDYVQHYGLLRRELTPGQYEPATELHSWDARETASSLMMLNAPRHADHHAHPARPYPALQLGETEATGRPILPRSLRVMSALALWPAKWFSVMDHRVLALRKAVAEDVPKVTIAPQA
ncbi:alkane 1-monooxygenase [Rhodobacter sp. JA431]|uniref:alkane 1-monooxygenase n=1 Tax=Rhodobacter sp. JA431 TaxID=570013 RepID=UPI000BC433B4|nr:alkane 1-monooxygenase [Rhodobacter sp. JA431]SOC12599.1 alkane 1-monooxygenase [Rhodobacter sp. JA431]